MSLKPASRNNNEDMFRKLSDCEIIAVSLSCDLFIEMGRGEGGFYYKPQNSSHLLNESVPLKASPVHLLHDMSVHLNVHLSRGV